MKEAGHLEMSDEELVRWEAARRVQKEFELSQFDKRLEGLFE